MTINIRMSRHYLSFCPLVERRNRSTCSPIVVSWCAWSMLLSYVACPLPNGPSVRWKGEPYLLCFSISESWPYVAWSVEIVAGVVVEAEESLQRP
jgi:hypothetical protein